MSDDSSKSFYRLHKGKPEATLAVMLEELKETPSRAAITGAGGKRIAELIGAQYVDPAVALIAAARELENSCEGSSTKSADGQTIRHVVDIGGASLSIVDLDDEGRFLGFRSNSLCAAGTGSFLDEPALRMNIAESEMSRAQTLKDPPRIAARCAVFAKSDLIHRQQEGFSTLEMWSGLCRGMVSTAIGTLFRGKKPLGPVLLAGAVALNKEVLRWLQKELGPLLLVPNSPETFSSRGAIAAANKLKGKIDLGLLRSAKADRDIPLRPKLDLSISEYPDFSCDSQFVHDSTEVRIHDRPSGEVIIGLDVGSTSTKAVLMDTTGKVLADLYRKTAGDPIGATKKIFEAIEKHCSGSELKIVGAGTTGSGRKMVGAIIGADRIINEISAHVQGALSAHDKVETIFEIGGQDSKFISIRNGSPHDSNMNYVCAAGTGSFVEEQAGKLGFKLSEIGDAVMGVLAPYSTDRCTVFMEQDVHALVRKGFTREEVMGSVLYSVVQNYLNKVVGRRQYSKEKICFMGATARNKGLVAAFEKLVGTKISVSPYCHVMGAFGVARIVLSEVVNNSTETKFVGLNALKSKVELKREVCELCPNNCTITHAVLSGDDGKGASFGFLCGRDPSDKAAPQKGHFELFVEREKLWHKVGAPAVLPKDAPRVGIPRALLALSYMPMWRRFFSELKVKVITSKPTGEWTLPCAEESIASDYCYPVKLAHGHVASLASQANVDFIFMPYMTQAEPHDDGFKRSVFCPYNICFPSIAKVAELASCKGMAVAVPVVNMQYDDRLTAKKLFESLKAHIKTNEKEVFRAWKLARGAQERFSDELTRIGSLRLERLRRENKAGIVILGRSYNVCDMGSNLSLPKKIAELGYDVIPVDCLPLKGVPVDDSFKNMYWRYGRKILQAAKYIADSKNLYAVYLTNFSCGPDSFLQTYVEKILAGKPMLMLEIDEHSADAGYITRLEAFADVISKKQVSAQPRRAVHRRGVKFERLWLPPLHPYGTRVLAGALRGSGFNAQALPSETIETFEMAKRYCRGTECVPAPATIGAFLNVLKSSPSPDKEAFFMPTAKGPCRFGQYHALHRIILDEAGYPDTTILSWDDGSGDWGLNLKTGRRLFNGIVASDALYKMRCRIRPYAKDRDAFDNLMESELEKAIAAIEACGDLKKRLCETANRLSRVELLPVKKPLVGIVGEIYVRANLFTNGHLVETIEDAGGEAWTAPLCEWFSYLTFMDKSLGKERGEGLSLRAKKLIKNSIMTRDADRIFKAVEKIIGDRKEPPISSTVAAGESVFPKQFDGESILTVGRAIEFAHQGASLIVNCAPFGCMPGILTSGIFQKLSEKMGVPVINLFFDGETDLGHLVKTYLANIRGR